MKDDYRVHAVEGVMVSTRNGILKLLDLYKKGGEKHQIFVISPVNDNELSLLGLLDKAESKDERLWAVIERSRNSWLELSENSLERDVTSFVTEAINASFAKVEDILKAVWLLEKSSEQSRIYLESMTSFFVASILSALFEINGLEASMFSVDEAVRKSSFPEGASFIYGKLLIPDTERRDALGRVRREGESEYTSSIIASNLDSPLTFWNHRSLLRTASIKDVPSAKVIKNLSYAEATELSFFGAPIVHPHSFIPAQAKGLPISLRYWGDADDEGTLVSSEVTKDKDRAVKAFSVVRNVSLINVEGSGMSGVPGVSSRLFTALRNEKISVIFISQASSEYSICFAVPKSDSQGALKTIRKEFSEELGKKAINSIEVENDCAILAAVGEEMPGAIGVAGKFFSSLARAGVNIHAIAQGSSERNISAVIKSSESGRALRSLHSAFFLSAQTLSVGLFGPGNIGGTLLDQLAAESGRLRRDVALNRHRAVEGRFGLSAFRVKGFRRDDADSIGVKACPGDVETAWGSFHIDAVLRSCDVDEPSGGPVRFASRRHAGGVVDVDSIHDVVEANLVSLQPGHGAVEPLVPRARIGIGKDGRFVLNGRFEVGNVDDRGVERDFCGGMVDPNAVGSDGGRFSGEFDAAACGEADASDAVARCGQHGCIDARVLDVSEDDVFRSRD